MRPNYIDQYIQADKLEKDAKAIKEKLRDEVINYLRTNDGDVGVKLSSTIKEKLSSEIICAWAKHTLTPQIEEKLYTKVFDPNAFTDLIRAGIIKVESLPKDYKEVKPEYRLTCTDKTPFSMKD